MKLVSLDCSKLLGFRLVGEGDASLIGGKLGGKSGGPGTGGPTGPGSDPGNGSSTSL